MKDINYYKAAERAYEDLELEIVQACILLTDLRRRELFEIFGKADFKLTKITFTIDQVIELINGEYSLYEVLNIIELGYIMTKNGDTWNDLVFNEDIVKIMIEDYI